MEAGGVARLLAVSYSGSTHFAVFDARGNVTAYLDASGSIVAQYDYLPFGGLKSLAGSMADDFSTVKGISWEWSDNVTGGRARTRMSGSCDCDEDCNLTCAATVTGTILLDRRFETNQKIRIIPTKVEGLHCL